MVAGLQAARLRVHRTRLTAQLVPSTPIWPADSRFWRCSKAPMSAKSQHAISWRMLARGPEAWIWSCEGVSRPPFRRLELDAAPVRR
jgi:hypothetical protein